VSQSDWAPGDNETPVDEAMVVKTLFLQAALQFELDVVVGDVAPASFRRNQTRAMAAPNRRSRHRKKAVLFAIAGGLMRYGLNMPRNILVTLRIL